MKMLELARISDSRFKMRHLQRSIWDERTCWFQFTSLSGFLRLDFVKLTGHALDAKFGCAEGSEIGPRTVGGTETAEPPVCLGFICPSSFAQVYFCPSLFVRVGCGVGD